MTLKTASLLLVFAILALFSGINWNVFIAPTTLRLLVTSVDAPLGLVLLGFIALISLMFLIYIVYIQAAHLSEVRRLTKELKSLRDIAEQAEFSRIKDLEAILREELARAENKADAWRTGLIEHLDRVEGNLRGVIEQSENGISAYIAEIEDRLTKK